MCLDSKQLQGYYILTCWKWNANYYFTELLEIILNIKIPFACEGVF